MDVCNKFLSFVNIDFGTQWYYISNTYLIQTVYVASEIILYVYYYFEYQIVREVNQRI